MHERVAAVVKFAFRIVMNYMAYSLFAFAMLLTLWALFVPWITFIEGTSASSVFFSWIETLTGRSEFTEVDVSRLFMYVTTLAWIIGEMLSFLYWRYRKGEEEIKRSFKQKFLTLLLPFAAVFVLLFASIPFMETTDSRLVFFLFFIVWFLLVVGVLLCFCLITYCRDAGVRIIEEYALPPDQKSPQFHKS